MQKAVQVAGVSALAMAMFFSSVGDSLARQCRIKGKEASDLVLMSIGTDLRFSGNCGIGRSKIVGTVTIKNVGEKKVPIVNAPLISVWDVDQPKFKDEDRTLQVLDPGESLTKQIRAGRFMSGRKLDGVHWFQIKVDRRGKVKECNKLNNTWPRLVRIRINCP
ncbi:hypothetical protein MnTg02_01378 [bacterium MnTg02]|nr:hypothetical protein MnTg02_01378 [bacterium MnTg02]